MNRFKTIGVLAAIFTMGCIGTHGGPEIGQFGAMRSPPGTGMSRLLPRELRSPPIAQVCPTESMSCYPGCATVGDSYGCGAQLILLAGGLAAATLVLAKTEGMPLQDFCNKYGVLCAKARPRAEPQRFPDNTPCTLVGSGGSSIYGKGLTCKYKCNGEDLVMRLDPPESSCPGEDTIDYVIKWIAIKWLEIVR